MLRSDDYGVKVFEIVEVDEAPVVTKTEVPSYIEIQSNSGECFCRIYCGS